MSFPRLLVVAFATLSASSAFALDQSSLRLAKQSPTSVVLSWSDPDPTVFCIVRDPSGVPTSLLASTGTLSYVDAAPSVPLLYYSVDEPPDRYFTTTVAPGKVPVTTIVVAQR